MIGPEMYPTPTRIGYGMRAKVSRDATNFLDPSAGDGALADVIRGRHDRHGQIKVDCIESDPSLISVLLGKGYPVVGYDWLTYSGVSYYDAILMNPPFSNGDEHLLKAWDFLYSGEIVCLLNAETVRNPYTKTRQLLMSIIAEHGEVEDLGRCFASGARRRTEAEVVQVYLRKKASDEEVDLWANVSTERTANENVGDDPVYLAIRDNLGNRQHFYDKATEHALRAFQHLRRAALYMEANGISSGSDYATISGLAWNELGNARAEFGRKHRRDAWMKIFEQMEFHRWLDKKQREQFLRDVETNGNIPFTVENIRGTLENIIEQRNRLFEQSCANVFDALTKYYNGNTNHVEGWKTNDSFKVNMKIVFPWGCNFDAKFFHKFELRYGSSEIDIYNDLDRVLAILEGEPFESVVTIKNALDSAFDLLGRHVKAPFNNRAESRYFEIKFWKKGTIHLKFKSKDLWARFNITASAGKRWLGQDTRGEKPSESGRLW
jgi:hypothetical protein